MLVLTVIVGLSAAAALLFAGYVLGAKLGYHAREQLRTDSLQRVQQLHQARERRSYYQGSAEALKENTGKIFEVLLRQGDALQKMVGQMVEPMIHRDKEVEDLRSIVQRVLAPFLRREQLALELSDLEAGSGRRSDLTPLLDQIAEKGHFEAVVLSDDEGLPLASSTDAKDLNRLAAISSLVMLFAERISRDGAPSPLSLMIHDEANKQTLCRIFDVNGQRLLLTAVSLGMPLTPTALDAVLSKVDTVLST